MKQSKRFRLTAVAFTLCFIIIFIIQAACYHPNTTPVYSPVDNLPRYAGFAWDATHQYAPIINGKNNVEDWHSALYMYECRALLYCGKSLGVITDGIRVQIAFYYLHLIAFLTCLSGVSYYLIRRSLYCITILIPLCFSCYLMFDRLPIGLDFFFFIHFFIMTCCTAFLPKIRRKALKILVWIFIVFTLFHAVNFRKNAILLVPFIGYIFVYAKTKYTENRSKWSALATWLLTSILFSVFSIKIVSWTLPVVHTHPLIPMLSSDLRVAAILRGEQEQFREELRLAGSDEKTLIHPKSDSLTAYWGDELMDLTKPYRVLLPSARYIYINHWINHTGSMFFSRIIQTVEFYCGGRFPIGVCIIEQIYPSIKTNSKAWEYNGALPKRVIIGRLITLLTGIILFFIILYKRYKKGYWRNPYDKPIAIACATAIIYAGSFTVVPPTADPRYLAPSLFILLNSSWLWFVLFFTEKRKKHVQGNNLR